MVETESSFDSADGIGVCYFNHAKEATLSPAVRLAGQQALIRPVWKKPESDDKTEVRKLFASLIGANPEDIAIMASTAFAMTVASNNIGRLSKGGKIIVLQDQMCSQVYPWQKVIEDSEGLFMFDAVPLCDNLTKVILQRLDKSVAAVSIPPLHWSHGSLVDLEPISHKCRELNVPLIVDATQAVGILPVDVQKLEPTFIACSIQKWLRAPQGLSLVYVNPKVVALWEPLDQHGRSRDFGKPDWNAYPGEMDVSRGYPESFAAGARKFDSGGNTNPILLAMLRASLQEVVPLDLCEAQEMLKVLMHPLLEWARLKGMWFPREHAYHLIGFRPNACPVEEMLRVCKNLESENIFVTVRNGVFRVSPYITNTEHDINRLIDGFERFL